MTWRILVFAVSAGITLYGLLAEKKQQKEAKQALNLSRIAVWLGVVGILVTLSLHFTQG
jgi:hypothetical protein